MRSARTALHIRISGDSFTKHLALRCVFCVSILTGLYTHCHRLKLVSRLLKCKANRFFKTSTCCRLWNSTNSFPFYNVCSFMSAVSTTVRNITFAVFWGTVLPGSNMYTRTMILYKGRLISTQRENVSKLKYWNVILFSHIVITTFFYLFQDLSLEYLLSNCWETNCTGIHGTFS